MVNTQLTGPSTCLADIASTVLVTFFWCTLGKYKSFSLISTVTVGGALINYQQLDLITWYKYVIDIWIIELSFGFFFLDRKPVALTTTCVISGYHHYSCEFEPCSWRGLLDTKLCYNVCQWLPTGWWFSAGHPVSSTNKIDRHDIAEILLKVTLNTINLNHLSNNFPIAMMRTILHQIIMDVA